MTIIVTPIRFTDNIAEMRAFLKVVGLRPYIESRNGGWVDLAAGAGRVGLHTATDSASGATQGETHLSFECDDVAALSDQLAAVGVPDVVVYDEAYNRSLTCTDPMGDALVVNGADCDLYGYDLHNTTLDKRLSVSAVRFTDPRGPYGGFLEALGMSALHTSEHFSEYSAGERSGRVGLHYVCEGELPIIASPAAVHLTFGTSQPLDDVRDRLLAAGYADAAISRDEFVAYVAVTDPDGRECQIHAVSMSDG